MSPALPLRLLQTQSDARLLAAARAGHERAFEALVLRYRKPLLRYCRRLLLPEARAEDALQQGLMKAWLALRGGTEVRDVRAWLYRIVHNAAVDALRSSGYDYEQLNDSLHGAMAPASDLERRTAVRQALAGLSALPELQREVLLRTAVDGHSYEQVAAALGISGGAVRGLVYRARTALRTAATALTPSSLVGWLADAGRRGAPLTQRLEGAGASGGAAGAAGALVKGGAAVLTAGALVAGATTGGHPSGTHAQRGTPAIITHGSPASARPASFMIDARTGVSASSRSSGGAGGGARDLAQRLEVGEAHARPLRRAQAEASLPAAEESPQSVSSSGGEAHAASVAAPAEAPAAGSSGSGTQGAGKAPAPEAAPGSSNAEPGDVSGEAEGPSGTPGAGGTSEPKGAGPEGTPSGGEAEGPGEATPGGPSSSSEPAATSPPTSSPTTPSATTHEATPDS
ncbi:MAG TPA: sigma-70 family RNA polymerase sigma factor [Candidatus Dormibacteraeota bacterium]|nr:sigma-70 family RNA polymerase sigma factor [Candidatus Dormibacteraeota bacterium]